MNDAKDASGITVADLRSYGWQEVLDQATEPDCHKYYSPLFAKAAELKKSEDFRGEDVFNFLGRVACFHPRLDEKDNRLAC
jgi:hypothetical protein